jgi:hypothetical protein
MWIIANDLEEEIELMYRGSPESTESPESPESTESPESPESPESLPERTPGVKYKIR